LQVLLQVHVVVVGRFAIRALRLQLPGSAFMLCHVDARDIVDRERASMMRELVVCEVDMCCGVLSLSN